MRVPVSVRVSACYECLHGHGDVGPLTLTLTLALTLALALDMGGGYCACMVTAMSVPVPSCCCRQVRLVGAPDGPEPTWCVAVGGGAGDRARAHLVHRRAVVHRV